jgi:putative ABC transport system permease protein
MNFKQAFKLAFKSMMGSKVRSLLTMLGIIIGVAAVIVLVSLVSGFSADMTASFEAMGTNLITVSIPGRGGNVKVTPNEMMDFALENADTIQAASPSVTVREATVKFEDSNLTTTVYGVNEYYDVIRNYAPESGRFLSFIDVEKRQKVCVLGKYTANELFESASAVDNEIKINGERYTVVGVLEAKEGAEEGSGDDMVIIPYTAASRLSRNAVVSSYYFSAASKETVDAAMTKIKTFLLSFFTSSDYYRVYNQADSLERVNELSGTLTLVLVGVAAISLLVGGIGIMNIMLVSVTERTKEIGIRKSLGGKRRDIMRQFIIEATTTSAIGGIMGILLGIGAAVAAGKIFSMSVVLSLGAIAIAFSVSVAIGILFGYFPASKASKLNPIDALRYD